MGNHLFVIFAVLDVSFAVNSCLNRSFFTFINGELSKCLLDTGSDVTLFADVVDRRVESVSHRSTYPSSERDSYRSYRDSDSRGTSWIASYDDYWSGVSACSRDTRYRILETRERTIWNFDLGEVILSVFTTNSAAGANSHGLSESSCRTTRWFLPCPRWICQLLCSIATSLGPRTPS